MENGKPERDDENADEGQQQSLPSAHCQSRTQIERQHDHERPERIELALRRQRPVMLHRTGQVVPCQIIHRIQRQQPVFHIEHCGQAFLHRRHPQRSRQQQPGAQQDRCDDQQRSREQPPRQTGPEDQGAYPTLPLALPEQRQRNQIAGHHEEHVHPTGDLVHPDVEDGDQQRGQCSQPFNIPTEGPGSRRSGLVLCAHDHPSSLTAS